MARAQIVHVVGGRSFTDFVARSFEEVVPGGNTVIAVGLEPGSLELADAVRVEYVPYGPTATDAVVGYTSRSDIAVFHNVLPPLAAALAATPRGPLRVWSGWGGDYYGSDIDPMDGLIGPKTRRLVRSQRERAYWIHRVIDMVRVAPTRRAAARVADVFSAPIPEDLDVFSARFRGFRGRYSQLRYASVEDSISMGADTVMGTDVLLGNSATPENNHLELMDVLSQQPLGDSKVYVPLNYGYPQYASEIAAQGARLFGERFVALTEPLPLSQYHEILSRCRVIVMGHLRQQGMGNILRGLWQGAHVVLDPRSPVARHLTQRGVFVSMLSESKVSDLTSRPLPPDQVASNRAWLQLHWGRENVLKEIDALVRIRD